MRLPGNTRELRGWGLDGGGEHLSGMEGVDDGNYDLREMVEECFRK